MLKSINDGGFLSIRIPGKEINSPSEIFKNHFKIGKPYIYLI